jgi:hypothetical protein
MALEAGLIVLRKSRKFRLEFVAPAAFFGRRLIGIRYVIVVFTADLIMRIVALDAIFETLPGGCRFSCVTALFDVFGDIFVAGSALFYLKKIYQRFIDVVRIRMQYFLMNVLMTILAGHLAVDAKMKPFGVN